MIPFSTETNTDFMQRLLDQPEEIGCKICFMWCDAKDFHDNEAAEIAECQCLNLWNELKRLQKPDSEKAMGL
jgi:hypothetical protein